MPKAKKSQPNKKTATPSVTSTRTRQQQERRPPTPHESSRPSATSPSTRKRKTNNHNVTPPTQEKRPRIHPLTTDDIPGIVQAVVNALPATPPTRDGCHAAQSVAVRIAPRLVKIPAKRMNLVCCVA